MRRPTTVAPSSSGSNTSVSNAVLGNAATDMARDCSPQSEECAAQVSSLAHVAQASELDRLTAQLATLGEGSEGDRVARGELQELVRRQLDIVRRMRDQSESCRSGALGYSRSCAVCGRS
jgi:hypothetical protein